MDVFPGKNGLNSLLLRISFPLPANIFLVSAYRARLEVLDRFGQLFRWIDCSKLVERKLALSE